MASQAPESVKSVGNERYAFMQDVRRVRYEKARTAFNYSVVLFEAKAKGLYNPEEVYSSYFLAESV